MEEVNNARLLAIAEERMQHYNAAVLVSENEVWDSLGITQEEMDSVGEVEIELAAKRKI